jgi:isocitrate dehydrogenase
LTTNLYGSITSNVICGLIGGAGLLSGRNYGDHFAVFEPGTRNTGSAIAGKNIANPFAMLNASVDMLNHLGHNQHANAISDAIYETIVTDKVHTAGELEVRWRFRRFLSSNRFRLGRNRIVHRCHPKRPQALGREARVVVSCEF